MKKLIIATLTATLLTAPAFAAIEDHPAPQELFTGNEQTMTESEIRAAYSELKDNYIELYMDWFNQEDSPSAPPQAQPQAPASQPTAQQATPSTTNVWTSDFYKDEFNNPTDRAYIINVTPFTGTFGNSATTDSELKAYVYSEPSSVSFTLIEYGDNIVKGDFSEPEIFDINVLTPTGETVLMQGSLYNGASGITLGDFSTRFNDILRTNGEVRVSMVSQRTATTKYFFTIPASDNFADLYASTFGA